jgi:hypothetical protein
MAGGGVLVDAEVVDDDGLTGDGRQGQGARVGDEGKAIERARQRHRRDGSVRGEGGNEG